jgi:hypothetical protein
MTILSRNSLIIFAVTQFIAFIVGQGSPSGAFIAPEGRDFTRETIYTAKRMKPEGYWLPVQAEEWTAYPHQGK